MAREPQDLWQALLRGGESVATEEEYEHGYQREVRQDLRQYVAFRVGDEIYGLPIQEIEEISKVFPTTPVPRTAAFVIGIGNVRGNIIPIIDLRIRLRLHSQELGRSARILIVKRESELYGLVVDEVLYVVPIAPESLEDAPGAISGARAEFIAALARHEGDLMIILQIDALLDPDDFIDRPRRERGRT